MKQRFPMTHSAYKYSAVTLTITAVCCGSPRPVRTPEPPGGDTHDVKAEAQAGTTLYTQIHRQSRQRNTGHRPAMRQSRTGTTSTAVSVSEYVSFRSVHCPVCSSLSLCLVLLKVVCGGGHSLGLALFEARVRRPRGTLRASLQTSWCSCLSACRPHKSYTVARAGGRRRARPPKPHEGTAVHFGTGLSRRKSARAFPAVVLPLPHAASTSASREWVDDGASDSRRHRIQRAGPRPICMRRGGHAWRRAFRRTPGGVPSAARQRRHPRSRQPTEQRQPPNTHDGSRRVAATPSAAAAA